MRYIVCFRTYFGHLYFFTVCSRACVETIIDAAMTCLDLIHHDHNACAWDIIIGSNPRAYLGGLLGNRGPKLTARWR